MCELLIEIKDNPLAPFETKKKGDVVVVMPDGHRWSPLEKLPYFLVVIIPKMSVKAGEKYLKYFTEDVSVPIELKAKSDETKKVWMLDIEKALAGFTLNDMEKQDYDPAPVNKEDFYNKITEEYDE